MVATEIDAAVSRWCGSDELREHIWLQGCEGGCAWTGDGYFSVGLMDEVLEQAHVGRRYARCR